jgi:hypothetical protein
MHACIQAGLQCAIVGRLLGTKGGKLFGMVVCYADSGRPAVHAKLDGCAQGSFGHYDVVRIGSTFRFVL